MLNVVISPLDITIPNDEVRLVALQPYIRLSPHEPYQWPDESIQRQINSLQRTLDVCMQEAQDQSPSFTIFPEYAIPGLTGLILIDNYVVSDGCPNNSMIIGGVHGLSKHEYEAVCQQLSPITSDHNRPASVNNNNWVNGCFIWAKDNSGNIQKWMQLKIRPAWPEINVSHGDMHMGDTVYVFECRYVNGYPCRIVIFICFDWVGSNAGSTACDETIGSLNGSWDGAPSPIHWVLIPQHNNNPNHPSFLNSTFRFLTDVNSFPFVERDNAIVVNANTAISESPGRIGPGGFSSCVLSPRAQLSRGCCLPTICTNPTNLRKDLTLDRCFDSVFREMGECIHAFNITVPRFIVADATGRTLPVLRAFVYPVQDSHDPRLIGGPIPCSVKWINDQLDTLTPLSTISLLGRPLHDLAVEIESLIYDTVRNIESVRCVKIIEMASSSFENGRSVREGEYIRDSDKWSDNEGSALSHIIHTLTTLRLVYQIDTANSVYHCALQVDDKLVQVLIMRASTFQDCRKHFDTINAMSHDPVLVIARDANNQVSYPREFRRIDESNADEGVVFVDYQSVLVSCRDAADANTLKLSLDGLLPENRRII